MSFIRLQSNTINKNVLGTTSQKIAKMTYKTPLSIALGLEYHFPQAKILFSMSYAYSGSNQIRQFVNYNDPKDTNALLGIRDNSASANINSFNLIVGFTYFLEKSNKK